RKSAISGTALRRPGARAFAAGGAPVTGAIREREAARAARALAAARDRDGHGAILADLAGDIEGRSAGIANGAVGDADRIAIGAIAGAALGDDENAPVAVERRLAGRDRSRGRRGGGSRGLVDADHLVFPVIRISLLPV